MSETSKDLHDLMLTSVMVILKDELGLARGANVGELIWKRFAEEMFPVLKEKYKLNSSEIPAVAEFIKKVYMDVFGFKNVQVTGNADKSVLVIRDCHMWTLLKQKKLPPLCHKYMDKFVETMARLANPTLVFTTGAHYRQGADRCEYEFKKF